MQRLLLRPRQDKRDSVLPCHRLHQAVLRLFVGHPISSEREVDKLALVADLQRQTLPQRLVPGRDGTAGLACYAGDRWPKAVAVLVTDGRL